MENDSDLIVTIRDDAVVAKINDFIASNNLDPRIANNLFAAIYAGSWPYPKRPHPSTLLFEESFVDDFLKNIDLSKCPKVDSTNNGNL